MQTDESIVAASCSVICVVVLVKEEGDNVDYVLLHRFGQFAEHLHVEGSSLSW